MSIAHMIAGRKFAIPTNVDRKGAEAIAEFLREQMALIENWTEDDVGESANVFDDEEEDE